MDALLFSLNAVLPLVLLSAFGFYLKKNGTISDTFVAEGNKFCYQYAFLALMFTTVYNIDSLDDIPWNVVLFAVIAIMVLFFIGLIYVIFFVKDPKQKGVVNQAFYRSNYATIGLPLSFNIYGEEGLAVAAIISAFSVPLYNVLGVIALSVFSEKKQKHPVLFVLKQIAINPLIHGVVLGMICVIIRPYTHGWRLDTGNLRFVYKFMDSLGVIAPWLSLVMLGGQFKFSSIKRLFKEITASVIARLVLAPVVGMLIVMFLPQALGFPAFQGPELAALFALFAAPLAIATVSMSDQMGGDSELAGQIIVWSATFSMLTLFVFIAGFRAVGIF